MTLTSLTARCQSQHGSLTAASDHQMADPVQHRRLCPQMAGTAWRRAATLVLSGRGPADELAVLMVRRSGKSRHLPEFEVFPGWYRRGPT